MFVCTLFVVFQQTYWICLYKQHGLNCSLDGCHGLYIWKTGRLLIMFIIVRLLTSVTFTLSSFYSPPLSLLTHTYTHSHTHTPVFASTVSPLPKHLCHLSLSSLKLVTAALLFPLYGVGEWKEWGRQKGKGKTEGTIRSFGRTHTFWKVLLWQHKTFLWHVSNWYFERAAHSAEVMGQFPTSAYWEMSVWC